MPDGLPAGLRQATGLLFATPQVTISDTEAGLDRVRFDLGPGYCVGLHAVQFTFGTVDVAVVNDESLRMGLSVDPQATAPEAVSIFNRSVVARFEGSSTLLGGSTSGAFWVPNPPVYNWPIPIFTVQDMTFAAFNDLNGTTDVFFAAKVYFAIYEVTDAQFMRIAGVSLARG